MGLLRTCSQAVARYAGEKRTSLKFVNKREYPEKSTAEYCSLSRLISSCSSCARRWETSMTEVGLYKHERRVCIAKFRKFASQRFTPDVVPTTSTLATLARWERRVWQKTVKTLLFPALCARTTEYWPNNNTRDAGKWSQQPLRAKNAFDNDVESANFAMTSSLQLMNGFDPNTFSSTQKAGFPPPRPDICPIEPNANLTMQFAKSHKTSITDSCSRAPVTKSVARTDELAIVLIATHRVPLAQPDCRNFDGSSRSACMTMARYEGPEPWKPSRARAEPPLELPRRLPACIRLPIVLPGAPPA